MKKITLKEFNAKLKDKRSDAVFKDCDFSNFIFRDFELENVSFSNCKIADIRNIKCDCCRFIECEFSSIYNSEFRSTTFDFSDFEDGDITNSEFYSCSFDRADMYNASFNHCIIDDSTLYGTNFSNASLTNTKITKCDTDECTCNLMLNCPEKGSFTAFKKARSDSSEQVVVELRVPADAKRSSATSRKCRVSKAKVISITSCDGKQSYKTAHACYRHVFKYTVGEVVKVDDFDKDRWNECAPGIHCFITRQEAVNYD